jgi:hypothetical protein
LPHGRNLQWSILKHLEKPSMKPAGWREVAVLLICVSIPCCFSVLQRVAARGQIVMIDFGALYYGARSAMHGLDPYNPAQVLREFQVDGGRFVPESEDGDVDRIVVTRIIYLPTALFLTLPFGLLPWGLAQNLWMLITAALLILATSLIWELDAGSATAFWAGMAGFILAESYSLLKFGNIAGITVSFCIIAVWCFLKNRCTWIGILLLAISLVLKPHDGGFIWLYFVIAGGTLRKRALGTLAVTAVLAGCAGLWIAFASPHWIHEIRNNFAFYSARGFSTDPGPVGLETGASRGITNLQCVFALLKDDPLFYNSATYLSCGILILIWALKVFRSRFSTKGANLALAAISALSLLPVYHRSYDAILLLLTLPACMTLWKERAPERWLALVLTSGAILLTATTPLAFLSMNFQALADFAARLPGRLPAILLLRPTPCILLAMGCFYLWVFLRYTPPVELPKLESASVTQGATQVM